LEKNADALLKAQDHLNRYLDMLTS
jgi:hypothetical protein